MGTVYLFAASPCSRVFTHSCWYSLRTILGCAPHCHYVALLGFVSGEKRGLVLAILSAMPFQAFCNAKKTWIYGNCAVIIIFNHIGRTIL